MFRIHVIDGEECVRLPLTLFAERLGYESSASVSPAFCDSYSTSPCKCTKKSACADILMIDLYYMPGMSSLELIRRQIDSGCKLAPQYKVVMTGYLTQEDVSQAKKLGCHILQKPITFEIFNNWLIEIEGREFEPQYDHYCSLGPALTSQSS